MIDGLAIRIKPVDQPLETIGEDTAQGIHPEDVELVWDGYGPATCQFNLRRSPRQAWPDLGTLADIEVDTPNIDRNWEGEIAQTPRSDGDNRVISVQGRGAQAELDDDVVEYGWVMDKLSDWVDIRSAISDLTTYVAAPQIQTGAVVSLTWPNGTATGASKYAGIMLDLGPGRTAETLSIDWSATSASGGTRAFVLGAGNGSPGVADASTTLSATNSAVAANTSSPWTPGAAYRYWYIAYPTGTTHTPSADETMFVTGARVFAKSTLQSAGASTLVASQVVSDVLDKGTMVMSTDRTHIDANATVLSSMATAAEGSTPREMIAKMQALHDWIFKVRPGRVPYWSAKSDTATLEVGGWTPSPDDQDASSNDIGDIVNRVIVRGTDPDGTPVRVSRASGELSGVVQEHIDSPAPTNPSFATNTTGWTSSPGTLTRDTGTYDTSPASMRLDQTGASDALTSHLTNVVGTMTGTFIAGFPYTLTFKVKAYAAGSFFSAAFGLTTNDDRGGTVFEPVGTGWETFSVTWTPRVTTASAALELEFDRGGHHWWIDSLAITTGKPTILDRRGRRRTKILTVSWPLPKDGVIAAMLGDAYLNTHKTTPFKGQCTIVGNQAVRDTLTGEYVPLDQLGQRTMELLRFGDRENPDTGAWGREGRMVRYTWKPAENIGVIDIDSAAAIFEALLAQIDVAVGNG